MGHPPEADAAETREREFKFGRPIPEAQKAALEMVLKLSKAEQLARLAEAKATLRRIKAEVGDSYIRKLARAPPT